MKFLPIYFILLIGCTQVGVVRDLSSLNIHADQVRFAIYKDQVFAIHRCADFKKKRLDHLWAEVKVPTYQSNRLKSLIQIVSDQCTVNKDFEVVLDHSGQIKESWVEGKGQKQAPSALGSQIFLVSEPVLNEINFSQKIYQNIFLSTLNNPTY